MIRAVGAPGFAVGWRNERSGTQDGNWSQSSRRSPQRNIGAEEYRPNISLRGGCKQWSLARDGATSSSPTLWGRCAKRSHSGLLLFAMSVHNYMRTRGCCELSIALRLRRQGTTPKSKNNPQKKYAVEGHSGIFLLRLAGTTSDRAHRADTSLKICEDAPSPSVARRGAGNLRSQLGGVRLLCCAPGTSPSRFTKMRRLETSHSKGNERITRKGASRSRY